MFRAVFLGLALWAVTAQARDLGYRYINGSCVDGQGRLGLNPNHVGPCADFRHVVMSRFSFEKADLRGSSFEYADLKESTFAGADLTGVTFRAANLAGVQFKGARLQSTSFIQAIMLNTGLEQSEPHGCDFSEADLSGARLEGVRLSGNRFHAAQFGNVNLQGADLSDSDLSRARFNHSNLERANLANASLSEAQFEHVNLAGADLRSVRAWGANFHAAVLNGANLRWALMTSANFLAARMERADLTGATLESADVRSANLAEAIYDQALVRGMIFNRRTVLPFGSDLALQMGMINAKAAKLLVLWESPVETALAGFRALLEEQGIEVAMATTSHGELQSLENLDAFTAVLHLAGQGYSRDMSEQNQRALVRFVNNGGTYVGTQWISYMVSAMGMLRQMRDLVLIGYETGQAGMRSILPVQGQETHAMLSGLAGETLIDANFSLGHLLPFSEHSATELLRDSNGHVILAVRSVGAGTAVNFAFSISGIGDHTLAQPSVQRLILNAIQL